MGVSLKEAVLVWREFEERWLFTRPLRLVWLVAQECWPRKWRSVWLGERDDCDPKAGRSL